MNKNIYGAACLAAGLGAALALAGEAWAHKAKHTPQQLQLFEKLFMDQVRVGDLLFHGDADTQKQLGVTLSKTGMACTMCHANGADVHSYEFPKYQEQMAKFATLRDMINWCIEKPNEGERIGDDSPAMKALEAYIYWTNRGSKLDPGRH